MRRHGDARHGPDGVDLSAFETAFGSNDHEPLAACRRRQLVRGDAAAIRHEHRGMSGQSLDRAAGFDRRGPRPLRLHGGLTGDADQTLPGPGGTLAVPANDGASGFDRDDAIDPELHELMYDRAGVIGLCRGERDCERGTSLGSMTTGPDGSSRTPSSAIRATVHG